MQFKPAVTALVSAVALATLLSGCKKEEAAPAAQAPQVGVVTIQPQPFTLTSELPGRTSAYRIAEVRPQVNGIILKRLFKEGSDVKEGQQLYQIDPAVYEAALGNAQANLQATRSLAERYKQLIDEQAVSKQEYDDANAKRLQAEASLKSAQIDLRYTKVLAPISGRIGRSAVTEGALVNNGQTNAMTTIQQLDPIYVDVPSPLPSCSSCAATWKAASCRRLATTPPRYSWCSKTAACSSSRAAWSSRKSQSTRPPVR